MANKHRNPRWFDDPFLRWIVGVAIGLTVLTVALFLYWGPGPMIIVLPWFVPAVHSFVGLAAVAIAFLSFGRYQVLRQPAPFWIGVAFSIFTVFVVFYVLSFPGLLPDNRGLISQMWNTTAWFYHLQFSVLAIFLLVAVFARWPRAGAAGERWWVWLVLAGMVASALIGWLSLVYERHLPILTIYPYFTSLNLAWNCLLVVAFLVTAALSAHRYQWTSDSLFGYVALTELQLGFAVLTSVIGGKFYDLWWYWQRPLWIGGVSVLLFGLLSEYVGLYRRQWQKTSELRALQQVTEPALGREGLEPLLHGLLERMVTILQANAGTILLLDLARQELVVRAAVGIPEEQAVGLRARVGESFAGQVAARNVIYWVRDAQADPTVWSPYVKANRIRAMLGAPMRVGGEVIGVVQVDFLVARDFGPEDKRLLELAAERASLALHQALLLEEAQEERNRLQGVITTAPVGIGFYLAPDGRLQLMNKAGEMILGRPPVPEVGIPEQALYYDVHRPSGEPFPPEDLPVIRSLRGETCVGVEILVRQPSGREVYILCNSAPLRDATGQIVGAILAFQDITAIREQEQLRDEFISAAAHELKTPVATIKGYAQLMRRWLPHEGRQAAAVEVINTQTDRINRRVQEMLEVIRFRKAPPELYRERFDLGDLAAQVVQRMQTTTELHRLALKCEEPVPVEADRERIEEVLVSLLDNAIKFSPKGGGIEVRVWAEKGEGLVSVMDHGVGIPKERQRYIFEPFYEPVPSGAPGYRAVVALSLYLSKLTIERHKGRIWFESEEGKGSTFCFSLPLAKGGGNGRGA